MPRTDKFPFRSDVRAKLIEVASRQETISYLDLGVGRAMVGRYLYRIAAEEALAGRPPLTSVVVRKDTGRPGEGFRQAMLDANYIEASNTEDEDVVWSRAVEDAWEYWRPKLRDDLSGPSSGSSGLL
jgi:hypothetical protein